MKLMLVPILFILASQTALVEKQFFYRTLINDATKPAAQQTLEECTIYEDRIESSLKIGDAAPVIRQLAESTDANYYLQSTKDLQNSQYVYNGGPTGLLKAFEYGALVPSSEPDQEYELLYVEQMTPNSEFYTQSLRREEWRKFIDDKCDRAAQAPLFLRAPMTPMRSPDNVGGTCYFWDNCDEIAGKVEVPFRAMCPVNAVSFRRQWDGNGIYECEKL